MANDEVGYKVVDIDRENEFVLFIGVRLMNIGYLRYKGMSFFGNLIEG